jgi:hypothetical protein
MKKFQYLIIVCVVAQLVNAQAPGIAWKQVTWNANRPDGTVQPTGEESGEDWWYSVQKYKNPSTGVHEGYLTCGYTGFHLDITNAAQVSANLAAVSPHEGGTDFTIYPDCGDLEGTMYDKGIVRGNVAKSDLHGNILWNKSLTVGELGAVRQLSDGNIVVIGVTSIGVGLYTGSNLPYNPTAPEPGNYLTTSVWEAAPPSGLGLTFPIDPDGGFRGAERKLYVAKLDPSGNVLWENIYGDIPYSNLFDCFDQTTYGYDIIEMEGGDLMCCGYYSNNKSSGNNLSRSFLLRIEPIVGYLVAKKVILPKFPSSTAAAGMGYVTTGNEWSQALALSKTNGPGATYFVAGTEWNLAGPAPYNIGYVLAVNDLLDETAITGWGINPIFPHGVTSRSNIWDLEYHVAGGYLAVPTLGNCQNCLFADDNRAEGFIYKVNPVDGSSIASLPIGNVNAYDLRMGVTETQDGGIAAVCSRRTIAAVCPLPADLVNPAAGFDNSACGTCSITTPPDFDYVPGYVPKYGYYDSDAYVVKFTSSGMQDWQKTFDADVTDPNSPLPRQPYPGNLKRQECLYKIIENDDGSLVIAGNTSHNFDDNYLVKIYSTCQRDAVYEVSDSDNLIDFVFGTTTLTAGDFSTASIPGVGKVKGMIRVKNSATLVLDGVTLQFADTRRIGIPTGITVEKGGKLIIKNNAKLTSLTECGPAMWDGIVVEGDNTLAQTATNQGTIEMTTGSIIDRAVNGISTFVTASSGAFDAVKSGGGIVKVKGGSFTDCYTGINFSNYIKYSLGNPVNNISYAVESDFKTTLSFGDGEIFTAPYTFIKNFGTWNIGLYANTFTNQRTSVPKDQWGAGVTSMDAQYSLVPKCGVLSIGACPVASRIGNKFYDLFIGVNVLASTTNARVTVDQGEFTRNLTGIQVEQAGFGNLTRNVFNIPATLTSLYSTAVGITLESSYGYKVEGNSFVSISPSGQNAGVMSFNTDLGGGGLNIYRNSFSKLVFGTETAGANSNLQIDCNSFSKSSVTFADIYDTDGTLGVQGVCSGNPQDPQANQFLGSCSASNMQIFKSPLASGVVYNSYGGVPFVPSASCVSAGVSVTGCITPTYDQNLTCPVKISALHTVKSSILLGDISLAKSTIAGLQHQIDGGNTQAILNYIANTSNPAQIKNFLQAYSPYLSDQVLIAVINKNLPPAIVGQILTDNSSLSSAVMAALQNQNLPNGISQGLAQVQTGTGAMIDLQNKISFYENQKLLTLNELVVNYLDSNRVDSAMLVLKHEGNTAALCAMVPLVAIRDTVRADSIINKLTTIAVAAQAANPGCKEAARLYDFCSFHKFMLRIISRPGGIYTLTKQERHVIENIAHSTSEMATKAKAILNFISDRNYHIDGVTPVLQNGGSKYAMENELQNKNALDMKVFPNPAGHSVNVQLNNVGSGVLELRDLFGRLIIQQQILLANHQVNLSLLQFSDGIYIVTFSGEEGKTTQKLIITK